MNVNESTSSIPDCNQGEGFFDSQAAKFVNKMGMELDKEIVEVKVNKKELSSLKSAEKDSDQNGLEIRKGIKVNAISFGTYFHGFGIRYTHAIF